MMSHPNTEFAGDGGGGTPLNWNTKEPSQKQTASIDLYSLLETDMDDVIKQLANVNVWYEEGYLGSSPEHIKLFHSNKFKVAFYSEESGKSSIVEHISTYYGYTKRKTDFSILGINGKTKKEDALSKLREYAEPYIEYGIPENQDIYSIIIDDTYYLAIEFVKDKVYSIYCKVATEYDFNRRED